MKNGYYDIVDRLGPPTWWDERGVPRYCDPSPEEVANIYARQVAFCVIACQSCGFQFLVAFSRANHETTFKPLNGGHNRWEMVNMPDLAERCGDLHYGDPPNYFYPGLAPHEAPGKGERRCCHAGATMNSDNLGCIRFYEQPDVCKPWKRNRQAEWGNPKEWWNKMEWAFKEMDRQTRRTSKAPSRRSRSRAGSGKGKRG